MVEASKLVTYLNGRFLPHGEAVAALQATDGESAGGFYDTERTFNGQVFKLRQHLERLYRGLAVSQIDPSMSLEEMEAATLELLEANRPLLGPGEELTITQVVSDTPTESPEGGPKVNVVIYCQPVVFSAFAMSYVLGVRVVTPETYGVPKRTPQSTASEGKQQVFYLMTGREGSITECKGANFMFVREGRIKLPDRREVLPGVSMQTVLELADSLGMAVDEDIYSTYDVYGADEAFVSSTRFCMLPVATLNGLRLGQELPGPGTRELLDAWRELVGSDFVRQALDHLSPGADDLPAEGA